MARIRFAILGSGSRGNATLVECGATLLLIDCGFSLVETQRRLARLKRTPDDLTAILITHEHSDHARGVGRLAARYQIPVFCTPGTFAMTRAQGVESANLFNVHESFVLGDLEVLPVAVPHDAREPSQFVFSDGAKRLGVLTDAGGITPHIEQRFDTCDALILECNHDRDMLANGGYPPQLKQRVGGPLGHLSNCQAAGLLRTVGTGRLQHLVAAHLSEQNNTPELASGALAGVLNCAAGWVQIADQKLGLAWREVA